MLGMKLLKNRVHGLLVPPDSWGVCLLLKDGLPGLVGDVIPPAVPEGDLGVPHASQRGNAIHKEATGHL